MFAYVKATSASLRSLINQVHQVKFIAMIKFGIRLIKMDGLNTFAKLISPITDYSKMLFANFMISPKQEETMQLRNIKKIFIH